ncbi:hypothetical protein GCM10010439_54890 [Actinocorallia aurantiaca]|uniref:Secreted protein n=1 Tax=Actinocorallia aurantiaca TaxID=46204 RepID=A0ABN3UJ97_9ACTN
MGQVRPAFLLQPLGSMIRALGWNGREGVLMVMSRVRSRTICSFTTVAPVSAGAAEAEPGRRTAVRLERATVEIAPRLVIACTRQSPWTRLLDTLMDSRT